MYRHVFISSFDKQRAQQTGSTDTESKVEKEQPTPKKKAKKKVVDEEHKKHVFSQPFFAED